MEKTKDYCDSCNANHGSLYVCPSYDDETKQKILLARDKHTSSLRSGEFEKKHGALAASIYKMFAGIKLMQFVQEILLLGQQYKLKPHELAATLALAQRWLNEKLELTVTELHFNESEEINEQ